jgi:hypothetical protein
MWPLNARDVVLFGSYLALAALIGLLAVAIRRMLRPSRKYLEGTFVEVNPEGVWRKGERCRSLLLGAREVQAVHVYRGYLDTVQRVVLRGAGRDASIEGLHDMAAFLNDVKSSFRHAKVHEH